MPTKRYKVLIVEEDGLELSFQTELALDGTNVFFDSNDFVADNTQDAIIELFGVAAPLRVPVTLTHNGTVSNGTWLGYTSLIPGDDTPIVSPISGSLFGFTWSNSNSASFSLTFRKGSTTATPFFTWSVDNTTTAEVEIPTPQSVLAGDTLFIQYIDEGTNASDSSLVLLFKGT